jgi:hypothetical protein
MSLDKSLDITVDDLVVVGAYRGFTIMYEPAIDRWHGVVPPQGQLAVKPDKALVHFFAYTSRADLLVKIDKHRLTSFERFFVLEEPELLPKQGSMFGEAPIAPQIWEVTSQATESEYWMTSARTKERRKRYLSGFYADTPENQAIFTEITPIISRMRMFNEEYLLLKNQLKRAELPSSILDTLLNPGQ